MMKPLLKPIFHSQVYCTCDGVAIECWWAPAAALLLSAVQQMRYDQNLMQQFGLISYLKVFLQPVKVNGIFELETDVAGWASGGR